MKSNSLWGMSIRALERIQPRTENLIRFGVVVTLKEINGINRLEEFIHLCQLEDWIVNEIDVNTQVEIYNILSYRP
ncbi:MAG: hypothetical protein QM571_06260 [Micrococcaceae bacterium]